jgi:hypothetical protein
MGVGLVYRYGFNGKEKDDEIALSILRISVSGSKD